jgi:hypothetical protein
MEAIQVATGSKCERAQDWGILRTGGVASTFRGTRAEAEEHIRRLNETDEQGSSEIITVGMTRDEAFDWIAANG